MTKRRFSLFKLRGTPEVVIAAAEVDDAAEFQDTSVFAQLVRERGNPFIR